MKAKIIAGVVVLVAAAALGVGWYFYTSPWYSPMQMEKAVEREHPDKQVMLEMDGVATEFMAMAYIPAGEFMMGSPEDEQGRGEDEGPRRRVTISQPFWMGKTEVTNKQFAAFVKATGHRSVTNNSPDDYPVVGVSWEDADAFCKWLSQETGQQFSLPTEAQWEFACRAGTNTPWFWGSDESAACEFANVWHQQAKGRMNMEWYGFSWCSDRHWHIAPAASFKPNSWGLHDTTGNVWEWCADWYGDKYYAEAPETDPLGGTTGKFRVLRGGLYTFSAADCRSANRYYDTPSLRCNFYGFRLLRTN